MTIIIAAVVALLIICPIAFGLMIRNAPEGWEDEAGFHFGEPYEGDK